MIRRSKACQEGRHATGVARGLTYDPAKGLCAGYAGALFCECTCHSKRLAKAAK